MAGKDEITFGKSRPTFTKKNEPVGNKGDFPELGGEIKQSKEQPKA